MIGAAIVLGLSVSSNFASVLMVYTALGGFGGGAISPPADTLAILSAKYREQKALGAWCSRQQR